MADAKKQTDADNVLPFPAGDGAATPAPPPEKTDAEIAAERKAHSLAILTATEGDYGQMRTGQRLRAIRELHGLAVEAVAKDLRYSAQDIIALERMEVENQKTVHIKGRLRNYAGVLNLPAETVISRYSAETAVLVNAPAAKVTVHEDAIEPIDAPRPWLPLAVFVGALLTIFLGALMLMNSAGNRPAPAPPITANASTGTALVAADDLLALPSDRTQLSLYAVQQGWLEVRGADGTIFVSRQIAAGDSYYPRVGAGWSVSARNAGAFEWRMGTVATGPLGEADAAVHSVSIDAAATRAAEALLAAETSVTTDAKRR